MGTAGHRAARCRRAVRLRRSAGHADVRHGQAGCPRTVALLLTVEAREMAGGRKHEAKRHRGSAHVSWAYSMRAIEGKGETMSSYPRGPSPLTHTCTGGMAALFPQPKRPSRQTSDLQGGGLWLLCGGGGGSCCAPRRSRSVNRRPTGLPAAIHAGGHLAVAWQTQHRHP